MRIALIGNQNSGKTTLFNALTGMNQKIGNWPGVTIEKKEGVIKGTKHELVDLPGIYSLTPYTMEEQISKDYILNNRVDLIINIVDVTSIERGLYLTTELLDLDVQVIVVLNMIDRLKANGLELDYKKLQDKLGVQVCLVSALKEEGIDSLISAINCIPNKRFKKINIYPRNIEEFIYNIENRFGERKNARYYAIDMIKNSDNSTIKLTQNKIKELYKMDAFETLITLRYDFITNICRECIGYIKKPKSVSKKLDSIFLNKFIAIPIFILIMFFIYYLSVGVVGNYTVDFINNLIENIKIGTNNFFNAIGLSDWINSLLCNGIITGVGGVISFIPQLSILFLCISILEATGYMSRISFLLDKFFRRLGLSGKALIPFIVGSGCSVPGIMSSRIIEDSYDRKVISILTPFIPCSAKLPIIALFSGYFFRDRYGIIATSFYIISVLIIIISSLIIKKLLKKKYVSSYISELPEYKFPNVKYVLRDVWDKISEFINKAGTLIFLSSVCVWFLLSFSINLKYGVNIEDSILAFIGKKISWIFTPLIGVNSWEASVSAIQGLIAKEQVVSSMEIISGLSEEVKTKYEIFGTGSPFSFFNQASSYAFVVFNLFSAPCFAAISTMKKELGGIKLTMFAIIFQTLLAWLLGVFVFNFLKFIL